MGNCSNSLWNPSFSHVYVEEAISAHPRTGRILSRLGNSSVIPVSHYKDVFCKKNQNFGMQRNSPKLILAAKREPFLYKGSSMCDDFGNPDFYYTADVMNCIYQCEYCYLQGLYPSANLVVFVNLEDTFKELEKLLERHPVYTCVSYDTDLLALEDLTGFSAEWIRFAGLHPRLTVELRTKSANFTKISSMDPPRNFILAWSLSPDLIIKMYEHRTPPLRARLRSASLAIEKGWRVRICIDPMLHIEKWQESYSGLISEIMEQIPPEKLEGISLGVFRVPKEGLKKMRDLNPESSLLAYPYILSASGWTYDDEQKEAMTDFIRKKVDHVTGI